MRGVKDTPVDCGEELPIREVLKVLRVVGGRVDKIDVTVTVEGIAVAVTVTYTTLQTMICTSEPDQTERPLTCDRYLTS